MIFVETWVACRTAVPGWKNELFIKVIRAAYDTRKRPLYCFLSPQNPKNSRFSYSREYSDMTVGSLSKTVILETHG